MTLSIEEEIFLAAGLLTDNYDPDAELEEGEEYLDDEERKEDLTGAREQFQDVRGRVSKISWEGAAPIEVGQDMPTDKGLRVRMIFGSVRMAQQETPDGKIIEGLPVAYSLGDQRVYAEPKQSLPGDVFKRFTINRMSPASTHEPMTRDTYVSEIADEIRFQLRVECWNDKCKKPVEHDAEECEACGQDLTDDTDDEETPEAEVIDVQGVPSPTVEA